ncbi:MBL fold metallo-hydrolase [Erysipelotrichaceae bacterium OttesenSCG-928-M19]|nr:MBL fold metallo-hydrolase [Erysipelotrichaceae bacterium OttesenSCG-928-M19]
MFLKVLVDNNTIIDDYALGEPGLAFYLEIDNKRILFDTGYSDIIINNALHYNIDLNNLDYIILSHGHNDHSRGLQYLIDTYDFKKTTLLAHPHVFDEKKEASLEIGNPLSYEILKDKMNIVLTDLPYKISDNLYFLGEIKRYNNFENQEPIGQTKYNSTIIDDYLYDDSALAYCENKQLTIITGCSHSGITNICEHAKEVTQCQEIKTIIGGFHLFEDNEQLTKTINYFISNKITNLYPCHCVSFVAKAKINNHIPITEVGVGFELKE